MNYNTSTVTMRVNIDTYDSLLRESEKIEIMLSLIFAEIISDNNLYDLVERIEIKRQSKETDYLSEISYNFTDRNFVESVIDGYAEQDPMFRTNYMLVREYYYHDLENLLKTLDKGLVVDYIFLNGMTVLFNFIVVS